MKSVVVVSPHRSGTSVTTRVVSLLGPSLCVDEDLVVKADNPGGHWESQSLMEFNDELLTMLGGVWFAPPELAPQWEEVAGLAEMRRRAVDRFYRVHPPSGWVWKDPRLCLLLPFWCTALDVDPVVVMTVRHPMEVARSLVERDGFGLNHALAIWEWHVVEMLEVCSGRPVVVVNFDDLVEHPLREGARLKTSLGSFGVDVTRGDLGTAADAVRKQYRHHREGRSDGLSPVHNRLYQLLLDLDDSYEAFSVGEEVRPSDSTVELVAAHRRIHRLQLEIEERNTWAFALRDQVAQSEDTVRALQSEFETRTEWALQLDRELRVRDEVIEGLQAELEVKRDEVHSLALALDDERKPNSDGRNTEGRGSKTQAGSIRVPGLEGTTCTTQSEFKNLFENELFRRRHMLEVFIARNHQGVDEFTLPGFCLVDGRPVSFAVDWRYAPPAVEVSWLSPEGTTESLKVPNWRERLVCPRCGLNNRQRAMAALALRGVRRQRQALGHDPRLYLMEQVTPFYRLFHETVANVDCVGSEFLGPDIAGGTVLDGLRHENAEALSFDDAFLDVLISNSVLEHVANPLHAIHEMARVLRPGGELFLEVPIQPLQDRNLRRAHVVDGEIEHLVTPAYHGNPMSGEGSLVFTDFGWELLEQLHASGFPTCSLVVYWSLEFGHLGGPQTLLHGLRA